MPTSLIIIVNIINPPVSGSIYYYYYLVQTCLSVKKIPEMSVEKIPNVTQKRADHVNYYLKKYAEQIESDKLTVTVSAINILGLSPIQCAYCDTVVKKTNWDELVPITKNGRMNASNQVPCCGSCNSSKGNKTGQDFELWLVTRGSLAHHHEDYYITCDRAISIIEYIDRYHDNLCYTDEDIIQCNTFKAKLGVILNTHYKEIADLITSHISHHHNASWNNK